jgi:hypothetical protein
MTTDELAAWLEDQAASVRGNRWWDDPEHDETEAPDPGRISSDGLLEELGHRLKSRLDEVKKWKDLAKLSKRVIDRAADERETLNAQIDKQKSQIDGFRIQLKAYMERDMSKR